MFKELEKINEYKNIGITGLTNELISFCVLDSYNKSNKNILVLTNSLYEANTIYSSLIHHNENTFLFPMDDFLTSEAIAISPDLLSIRINTLNEIANNNKNNIVVTNLMGFLRYLPSKRTWKNSKIIIKKGNIIDKEDLELKINNLGYQLENIVTNSGEYASRGFILDIFPLNYENPIRIEFWGDEIDSIRLFDLDTQRSLEEIEEIEITSNTEFINEKNIDIDSKQKYLPMVTDELSSREIK